MTAVRELLARRSDIRLEFVRHRSSGRVHVATPADPDAEPECRAWEDLSEEEKFQAAMALARRVVPTLCGFTARVYLDGRGDDEIVRTFADEDLCWACHRALGPEHEVRAFEHPQPGVDPDAVA